jgi:hypothetical protein
MCQTIKNLLTRKPENRLFLESHKKQKKKRDSPAGKVWLKAH